MAGVARAQGLHLWQCYSCCPSDHLLTAQFSLACGKSRSAKTPLLCVSSTSSPFTSSALLPLCVSSTSSPFASSALLSRAESEHFFRFVCSCVCALGESPLRRVLFHFDLHRRRCRKLGDKVDHVITWGALHSNIKVQCWRRASGEANKVDISLSLKLEGHTSLKNEEKGFLGFPKTRLGSTPGRWAQHNRILKSMQKFSVVFQNLLLKGVTWYILEK